MIFSTIRSEAFMVYFMVLALSCYIYEDSDSLIVNNDSLTICGNHLYNLEVHILNGGKLKVRQWGYEDTLGWLVLNAPVIIIEDSSSIIGSGRGYWGGSTGHPDGFGPGYGSAGPMGGGGGGAYGGSGGDGGDASPGSGGSPYGDPTDTLIDIGSGGGAGFLSAVDGRGGDGGAKIYLHGDAIFVDSSYIQTDGNNGADGGYEAGGGGSGGGIMILADSIFISYSELDANGGDGGNAAGGGGGGGGGGRIKIFYGSHLDTSNLASSVSGGAGGFGSFGSGEAGTSGSVYIEELIGIKEIVQKIITDRVIISNPVRNGARVVVKSVPHTLYIYDVSGRLVKTFKLKDNTEFIDLHDLKQGIYFLKSAEENKTLGKIVLLK